MTRSRIGLATAIVIVAGSTLNFAAHAKVPAAEADRLGNDLMPLGGEMGANADGSIPAWTGGMKSDLGPEKGRNPASYAEFGGTDKPLFTITSQNMSEYADMLTEGHKAMFKQYPDTFKMPVYPTRRNVLAPDAIYAATKQNALNAELANEGESLVNAVTGIPFPIPQTGKEVIWNHKTRYRSIGVTRYNTQLAVQTNGSFTPYKLREDVMFSYSQDGIETADLENVIIYFLQVTTAPPRQAGQVLLVHETMDQVKEPRRAWLYNPGQRRTRRAPNVAYDNPGTGADGLRTNDQLDMFNGATDRYDWKLVGKKEIFVPYNAFGLADSSKSYDDITAIGHLNPDVTRYEKHRVWVLDSSVKDGTSHIYKRRTFYVDEDSWTAVVADIYDKRDQLWRVQEYHQIVIPWTKAVGPAAGTVYD
ncbi:MAG: DUF1329 domain-containing protein, partial [Oceanococcus sp.]